MSHHQRHVVFWTLTVVLSIAAVFVMELTQWPADEDTRVMLAGWWPLLALVVSYEVAWVLYRASHAEEDTAA